tara:strand:+ start:92 stop:547 length:456 start_codon:yes stop_codon:yes gene_type:complete
MTPKLATIEEIKEIYAIFAQYKDVFPHIRFDYLQRKINSGCCVYEDDVVITYTVYKRKQRIGDNCATKGEVILHQIVNANPSNGKGAEVLNRFFEHTVEGKPVWLTVRTDNKRAIKFYEKIGFEDMGNIYWMKGKLPGKVFRHLPKTVSIV